MNSRHRHEPRGTTKRAAALRDAAGRAFTLLEVIVAVAAAALVAVGLASIFDAVGKTVSGGKRVSLLNQYAGLIENQMRKDFSEMTRDGFLVIRQQNIDGAQVSAGDENPRARRADEIIFFARGEFETSRAPVHPEAVVTSDTAMIYYGHGQRRRPGAMFTPPGGTPDAGVYFQPRTDDTNEDPDAVLGSTAGDNPNRYAGDWTLLRKQVLLVKPDSGQARSIPSAVSFVNANGQIRRLSPDPSDTPPPTANELSRIANSEWQIALQPVARSVFRSLNRYFPSNRSGSPEAPLDNANLWFRDPKRSLLSSGLVDIAATDLAEIKSVVQGLGMGWDDGAREFLAQPEGLPRAFSPLAGASPEIYLSDYIRPFSWSHPFPTPIQTPAVPAPSALPTSSVETMQVWMNDAFPTEAAGGPRWGATNALRTWDPPGMRPRSELEPVDLLSVIAGQLQTAARQGATDGVQAAYERADQLMLISSNFLPRCSEFAVDWSFGQIDPDTNELIWHGPATRYDSNADGAVDGTDEFALLPYPFNAHAPTPDPDAYHTPGTVISAEDSGWHRVAVPRLPYGPPTDIFGAPSPAKPYPYMDRLPHHKQFYDHVVSDRLIYGYRAWVLNEPAPAVLTSYFGFADPTYKQDIVEIQNLATYNRLSGSDFAENPSNPPDFLSDGRLTPGMQVDRSGNGFVGTTNGSTISLGDLDLELIPGEPAPASIPWAWPKMARVTITLSDTLDPTIESTFQFVFNIAADPPIKR